MPQLLSQALDILLTFKTLPTAKKDAKIDGNRKSGRHEIIFPGLGRQMSQIM